MRTIVQTATSADWLYLLDSAGSVWEKPLPAAQMDTEKWETLPPLPAGYVAGAMVVSLDGAVHVTTKCGTRLFRYLADRWEDETPIFDDIMTAEPRQ